MTESWLEQRGLKAGIVPVKGRCLYAANRFSPGEVVLDQSPFVAALNSYTDKRCDGCYKEDGSFKRCSSCKSVWYCSFACQRREWSIHKYECKCLVKLMAEKGRDLTPSLRLMLRLLIKRRLQKDKTVTCSVTDNYEVVEALPTHFDDTLEQQLILYAQMANLLRVTYIFEDVDVKEIAHNFCRFACNAHTICDLELRPLGVGLYPVISIINHSCHPNCILLFEGKQAYIRAIEEISEGTEVTVSYVELGENTATRQKNLRDQYFFDCTCLRCLGQAPCLADNQLEGFVCSASNCRGLLVSDQGDPDKMVCQACDKRSDKGTLSKQMSNFDTLLDKALTVFSAGNLLETKHLLERVDKMQAQIFQESSLHRIKTYESLLKVCMALEDWMSSLSYCHKAISAYRRVYQPNHPLLGLQFYTSGKLEWYLGKTANAVESYRQALNILEVTHGSNSQLVHNLKAALQEAQVEAMYLQRHHQR